MTGRHVIGRLSWEVEVADEHLALDLHRRLDRWTARHLPTLLDRVLASALPEGQKVVLDRLDLDLGLLPEQGFEQALALALESALTDGLAAAVAVAPRDRVTAGEGVLSAAAGRVWGIRHYLIHGTLPMGPVDPGFLPRSQLARLAADQPRALADLLRQTRRQSQVAERLVLQADDASLRLVLAELESANAPLILAYLGDLGALHRADPLVPLGETRFCQLVWVLTLRFLLSLDGSHFNQKSYVADLLRKTARATGLEYHALLESLRRALESVGRRLSIASSLPAVLQEVLADGEKLPPAPDLRVRSSGNAVPPATRPADLVRRLRALAGNLSGVKQLIRATSPDDLTQMLVLLDREHAPLVQSYMADVIQAHRVEPLVRLGEQALTHLLWVLALAQMARQSGSQFNRRVFVGTLLRDLAEHEAIPLPDLLATLRRGLAVVFRTAKIPGGLLLDLLDALLADLTEAPTEALAGVEAYLRGRRAAGPSPALMLPRLAASHGAGLAMLVRRLAADPAVWPQAVERLLEALTPEDIVRLLSPADQKRALVLASRLDFPDPREERRAWAVLLARLAGGDGLGAAGRWHRRAGLIQRFDRMAALYHLLQTGRLPWWAAIADPPLGQAAAVAGFSTMPPDRLRRLFAEAEAADRPRMAATIVALLGEPGARALLERLAPWAAMAWGRTGQGPLARLTPDLLPMALARLLAAALGEGPVDLTEVLAGLTAPVATAPAVSADPMEWALDDLLAAAADPVLATEEPERFQAVLVVLARRFPQAARQALTRLPDPVRRALRRLLPPDPLDLRRATLDFLAGSPSAGVPEDVLIEASIALADAGDRDFRDDVRRLLRQPQVRGRWSSRLPDRLIVRLVRLSEPGQARLLIDVVDVLGAAWRQTAPQRQGSAHRLPWAALFDYLADQPRQQRSAHALVPRVLAALGVKDTDLAGRVLDRARDLARTIGHAWLPGILRPAPVEPPRKPSPPPVPHQPAPGRTAFGLEGGGTAGQDGALYVDNAGLVLAGPFLPHLFRTLDLLGTGSDGKPALRDVEAASRAVHLLQWLVDEQTARPEPGLALNKVLCGLDPGAAIEPSITPTEQELGVGAQLLAAMLANWTILSKNSPAALREGFLQREGRLERRDGGWHLTVQRKTLDVLVDQVPWGFSMIFHPWQRTALTTTW